MVLWTQFFLLALCCNDLLLIVRFGCHCWCCVACGCYKSSRMPFVTFVMSIVKRVSRVWWWMPVIPAFKMGRLQLVAIEVLSSIILECEDSTSVWVNKTVSKKKSGKKKILGVWGCSSVQRSLVLSPGLNKDFCVVSGEGSYSWILVSMPFSTDFSMPIHFKSYLCILPPSLWIGLKSCWHNLTSTILEWFFLSDARSIFCTQTYVSNSLQHDCHPLFPLISGITLFFCNMNQCSFPLLLSSFLDTMVKI